jgi:putative ABC transport system permease protein
VIRLVWDAVRGRRAQALTVLVLTGLAVGIATAAPWYVFASGQHLTEQYVANATPTQRILHLTGERASADATGTREVPAADIVKIAETAIGTAHEAPIASLAFEGSAFLESSAKGWLLARDGTCEHAVVDGTCPTKQGEIMISRDLGARFNIGLGSRIVMILGGGMAVADLRVTGFYRPSDPSDLWWSGIWDHGSTVLDPFFTPFETVRAVQQVSPVTAVDLILLPPAYTNGLGDRLSKLKSPEDWQLAGTSFVGVIPGQVGDALAEVSAGVVASTGRFVLLAWFALLVVVRHTVTDRRPDLALVKLRGVRRWRMLTATTGQTVSVMLAGAVGGGALGWAAVRFLIGPVEKPEYLHDSVVQSALLFGGVLAAALALAFVSEMRSLRTDVVELLRTVPPRVRRRAVDIAELVAAFLLAVGIWQLSTVDFLRGGSATAALVPGLLAIAVGLLASRFVLWLAGGAGRVAMRGGRLAVALAGLAAKRRPTMRWVITLLVVAVAGLTTALGETVRASEAVTARAEQQLGAARVLSVTASSRSALLQGVRQADPTGTRAMAVSYLPVSVGFSASLLAVDTARLGRVADWRPEYGPVPQSPNDEGSDPIRLSDGPLTLTAGYDTKPHASGEYFTTGKPDAQGGIPFNFRKPPAKLTLPTYVEAVVVSAEGRQSRLSWGPLTAGTKGYKVDVTGCATGCRLEYLGLYALHANAKVLPQWGTQVRLASVAQAGTPVLTPAQLGERERWSGIGLTTVLGPQIAGTPTGLTLTVPPGCEEESTRGTCDLRVFPASAPLAAYVAGNIVRDGRDLGVELSVRSGDRSPAEIAGAPAVLPRLGRSGSLVDLAGFDQVAGPTLADERFEVWLAPGSDDALLQRLRDAGLTVRDDRTTTRLAADLQQQGPGAVRRYQLTVFFLGVLIAAFALALAAAVDRRTRADELIALRRQGLDRRTVRSVVFLDYGVPLGIAVVAGFATAAAAAWLPLPAPAVFADGWRVIDPPGGLSWSQFGLAAAAVGAIMAATLALIARRLTGSALRGEARR